MPLHRDPALHDLSRDHHHALVLARRARLAAEPDAGTDPQAVWTEVRGRFAAALDPHFVVEEETLAPAMRAHGEEALVERLLDDHAALRAMVATESPADIAVHLLAFGKRLRDHIRWEEEVLFERAQVLLTHEELAVIAEASLVIAPLRESCSLEARGQRASRGTPSPD